MLQIITDDITECYGHAAECNRRAEKAQNHAVRDDFLNMERRWLWLARNHEFAQRLSEFGQEASRAGASSAYHVPSS